MPRRILLAGRRRDHRRPQRERRRHRLLVALGVPRQEVWIARNHLERGCGGCRRAIRLLVGSGSPGAGAMCVVCRANGCVAPRSGTAPRSSVIWSRQSAVPRSRRRTGDRRCRRHAEPGRLSKRLLGVAVAGSAVVALSPALSSPSRWRSRDLAWSRAVPPGARQEGDRRFTMLKFQSVCVDAERRLNDLRRVNSRRRLSQGSGGSAHHPVGRFLGDSRSTNCLSSSTCCGEMSIVGPRPACCRARSPSIERRWVPRPRPGLTGVADVRTCRRRVRQMVGMDVAYGPRSRSLLLDVADQVDDPSRVRWSRRLLAEAATHRPTQTGEAIVAKLPASPVPLRLLGLPGSPRGRRRAGSFAAAVAGHA